MSKSNEKSTTQVTAVLPDLAPLLKSTNNGKREAKDEHQKQASAQKKQKIVVRKAIMKKKEMSSSEDFSSDEETAGKIAKKDPVPAPKNVPMVESKKVESSDSSSEEDEKNVAKVPAGSMQPVPSESAPGPTNNNQESSGESSLESDLLDDEECKDPTKDHGDHNSGKRVEEPQSKKADGSASANKSNAKTDKKESISSGDRSDDELSKVKLVKKPTEVSKESSNSDGSSVDKSEEEEPAKTPKKDLSVKGNSDEEMVHAGSPKTNNKAAITNSEKKAPKSLATPQVQNTGSKTVFVGNLSFSVKQKDLEKFFKDAGEIISTRIPSFKAGTIIRYGHVEFATEAAAQKAFEMNGHDLLGRAVRLEPSHERGSSTPHTGKESNSYLKGGRVRGRGRGRAQGKRKTICVPGFDKSVGINQIQSNLNILHNTRSFPHRSDSDAYFIQKKRRV